MKRKRERERERGGGCSIIFRYDYNKTDVGKHYSINQSIKKSTIACLSYPYSKDSDVDFI